MTNTKLIASICTLVGAAGLMALTNESAPGRDLLPNGLVEIITNAKDYIIPIGSAVVTGTSMYLYASEANKAYERQRY